MLMNLNLHLLISDIFNTVQFFILFCKSCCHRPIIYWLILDVTKKQKNVPPDPDDISCLLGVIENEGLKRIVKIPENLKK
jgi:hypothetical protein